MRTKKDRCGKEGWGNGGARTHQASERYGTRCDHRHRAEPLTVTRRRAPTASWMRGLLLETAPPEPNVARLGVTAFRRAGGP
eukprot:5271515-Prymnesium_polylepis.1